MTIVDEYFGVYQVDVQNLTELDERVKQVQALGQREGITFFWRGQSDASWGLHSLLHRKISESEDIPIENLLDGKVIPFERRLMNASREWIRPGVGARLATVDLFARLQHYGVPTRFIDFTKNYRIALYFSVVHKPQQDGRIIIAAARGGVPDDKFRESFGVPWQLRSDTKPEDWSSTLFALDDQADFVRITRQEGVFLIGGTPSTSPRCLLPDGTNLRAHEVRACMSIPLRLHSWSQAEAALEGKHPRGKHVKVASGLTLRIPADAKRGLRGELEDQYGLTMSALFPDPEGFRQHSKDVRRLLRSYEPVQATAGRRRR